MTVVNVTGTSNTVLVTENDGFSAVVTVPTTQIVTAVAVGPQGAAGPQGDNDNAIAYSIALS